MKVEFKLIDGKIFMTVSQRLWSLDGEEDLVVVLQEDVTEKVMPVVDDYLDERLGLNDYNTKR